MLPTKQRLHPGQETGPQGDDRLVGQEQLTETFCRPQVSVQFGAVLGGRPEIEYLDGVG